MDVVEYSVALVTRAGAGHVSFSLETPELRVRALELREAINEPFWLELTVISTDVHLAVDGLVGAALTLTMRGGEFERDAVGVVTSAVYLGTFNDTLQAQLIVRPSLALAELTQRSRIFQGLSVPEIVRDVAGPYVGGADAVDLTRLAEPADARDYCVQFRETDLAFMHRILAEEGIHYVLAQAPDEEGQTLVLLDSMGGFEPVGLYADDPKPTEVPSVPVITDRADLQDTVSINAFEWRRSQVTAIHTNGAADWLAQQPSAVEARVDPDDTAPWEEGTAHIFSERRTLENGAAHLNTTDRLAALLRERAQSRSSGAFGHSTALGFRPGTSFALTGHPSETLDRDYLLTRVTHRADCPETDVHEQTGLAGESYTNRFECHDAATPIRPELRDKPRAYGQQTATVVGPPGEEIHTDTLGRIKVWMHWDRDGTAGAEDRTCWLRVAQPLAGPGFGTMFLPRVGMEVLVSFVDGDPDRPVCVGCLYNGGNATPYALPEDRTKTTIKTRSSPGGNGFNELRFEDAAGSEQVFLHAQRNLDETVRSAHTMSVGATQNVSVGADQTLKVDGSREMTIAGNHTVTINGTPKDGVPVGHTMSVVGDIKIDATKTAQLIAPLGIEFICGNSIIKMTPDAITLVSGGKATLSLTAALAAAAAGGAVQLAMAAGGTAMLETKTGTKLSLDNMIKMKSTAGSTIDVDGSVALAAAGGGTLKLSANAELEGIKAVAKSSAGAKITLTAGAEIVGLTTKLESGASSVETNATSTKIEGTTVSVNGVAAVNIAATIVKVN